MFADLAIAKKCKTALVDPPKAITNEIAFSMDFFEIISSGLISFKINFSMDFPTSFDKLSLFELFAGMEEENGSDIPNASIAEAIVLAVYIPPHAPEPGQDFLIICLYSISFILPETLPPHASNAETISSFLSL